MDIADHVTSLLSKMFKLPADSVLPRVPLHHLSIDSLALEELRLVIEDELSIDLDDVNLTTQNTVGQLVDVVCERSALL